MLGAVGRMAAAAPTYYTVYFGIHIFEIAKHFRTRESGKVFARSPVVRPPVGSGASGVIASLTRLMSYSIETSDLC